MRNYTKIDREKLLKDYSESDNFKEVHFRSDKNQPIWKAYSIAYVQASGHYVKFFYKRGAPTCRLESISVLITLLDPRIFLFCHRSYIINLFYLKSYWTQGERIVAKTIDGDEIPVSHDAVDKFKTLMQPYIEQ